MDKYQKIRKIGEGSFGMAILVRSKTNGKQMVVKEVNMSKMARKEREEARKEVTVLAQLIHPNVVAYAESFEEIGNLYIVMDYCDAGDLFGKISAQRGMLFQEEQVLDWFVQTCLAVKHIHDRKILHRDIKSQNIFLTRHGIVKLGDFGIAKVLNSTVELARTCIGTPYYLSPEICDNKPYNNKSDIWSLGCVLYELVTLKHAFEAGNMKNLVLKIIRGSYPPPPPKYSYELRSLIALLFKRSPRDRPSINSVLKKTVLQTRIRKFLSDHEMADEFSHTVMHGVKIKKDVPLGAARPLPPKPQQVVKPPISARNEKYNPASVYGPSVARKSASRDKKPSEVQKSGGNVRRAAPSPAPGNHMADLNRRRQELLERERRRREEVKKKEQLIQQDLYEKRHRELVEKQKGQRIDRARDEGWRNLVDSISSEDSEAKSSCKSVENVPKKSNGAVRKSGPSPRGEVKPSAQKHAAAGNKGKYEHYHDYLDKLQQDKPANRQAPLGVAGAMGYGGGGVGVQAARQGAAAANRGAEAAGRARVVGEYVQRKKEAAFNKARAHGDYGVGASPRPAPAPTPSSGKPSAGRPYSARDSRESKKSSESRHSAGHPAYSRDDKEQEYLAKLKQIRLQNFNERQINKAGKVDPKYKPPVADAKNDPDVRRRKIEALKAQADERAKKLREDLERKRKDAYESEQKRIRDGRQKGEKVYMKPAAPIPMTEAMKAIGVVPDLPKQPAANLEKCPIGMTAAMEAIGAKPSQPQEKQESDPANFRSPLQKKKEAILKRLNSKPPVPDKPNRPKWGDPVKPAVAERLKWGAGNAASVLRDKSLEDTGSNMEATTVGDSVTKHPNEKVAKAASEASTPSPEESSEAPPSSRKQWGGPRGTVLNVLQHADITESGTLSPKSPLSEGTMSPTSSQTESESSPVKVEASPGTKAPAIGTTITIARNPNKGTVVIKKIEQKEEAAVSEDKEGSKKSRSPSPKKDRTSRSPSPSKKPSRARSWSPSQRKEVKSPLFDRVELVEDEAGHEDKDQLVLEDIGDEEQESPRSDEQTESTLKKSPVKDPAMRVGLSTGHFDVDVNMLRTCSEPDLSKLFSTMKLDLPKNEESASVLNLNAVDDILVEEDSSDGEELEMKDLEAALEKMVAGEADDDEDEDSPRIDISLPEDESQEEEVNDKDEDEDEDGTQDGEDEDNDEAQEDSDEEDLKTMRESMMSLLATDDAAEEEPLNTSFKKKIKKGSKKTKKTKKKKDKTLTKEEWSNQSASDLQNLRETMKTLLQPQPEPVGGDTGGAGDAPPSNSISTMVPGTETWQSDNEDDDYFEEEDMFSRLEANRAKLEQELGCETFLKAYKTVQDNCKKSAVHEDEDEDMEQGLQLISSILHDKSHLYPSILQLVMADGVFAEDNN